MMELADAETLIIYQFSQFSGINEKIILLEDFIRYPDEGR